MRCLLYLHGSISTSWWTGINLKESHVKRAVELSADKYCSASIMLGAAGVDITHSYELLESDPAGKLACALPAPSR